jgi:hypothetical protein
MATLNAALRARSKPVSSFIRFLAAAAALP